MNDTDNIIESLLLDIQLQLSVLCANQEQTKMDINSLGNEIMIKGSPKQNLSLFINMPSKLGIHCKSQSSLERPSKEAIESDKRAYLDALKDFKLLSEFELCYDYMSVSAIYNTVKSANIKY
ncbi:hypothetical protein PHYBLDRAFT_165377 [Phycomyces blakesleeanus NRRL 1555(-)]|uniref:Uncharacterized protein n=1 Tax=Phycomyces blakesleeanus (strain ATCC 8743b / DSM 1359 / FGSC 10004 / NBRC 33097 / NRRL 1555) TaxID=763407 RepID=A0A167NYF8_PHYB8|nr:hypothetical protein PHYBLDRAFT_165377 [Phycomyces blakesleeanus NRRL 1555(-)]OAD76876.1 hypothetical protein PHYBLDRAFT_165377 [Phycomyces blakesleeanus NRRL 1555(-)]|eukprot:XP_018294916.1 hypothetical protein PHYBLDRAFT_165377 [Phycomyces blakesleeanus NRRL 1555(-)]